MSHYYQKKLDQLRAKIEQLPWILRHTQPDVSFSVRLFASKLTNATVGKLETANKMINKIKADHYKLKFLLLDLPVKLLLYTDAAFRNHNDGNSQGLHVYSLQKAIIIVI